MAALGAHWSADFSGRHVVVTGAAGGLGAAIASLFAEAGAAVTAVDLEPRRQTLDALVEGLRNTGGHAQAQVADITEQAQLDAVFRRACADFGCLTNLVNVAGIYENRPLEDCNDSFWQRMLEVNLLGARNASQAFLQHSDADCFRAVVNIGSDSGRATAVGDGVYAVSKSALETYTRHFALETAAAGVRVNLVAPGWMLTEMTRFVWSDRASCAEAKAGVPLGYLAEPAEIAKVVLFLSSGAASYLTGQCITVNGGRTFQ